MMDEPQMCTVDDLTGEPPCLRVAQHVWHPEADDHPVYLCNFHAEPFAPFPAPAAAGTLQPGHIEIDGSGPVRVRFTLPQEWFTLHELRQFAAYLTLVCDENEPSPEVSKLAEVIETAGLLRCDPKAAARQILASGYRLEQDPAEAAREKE